MPARNDGTPRRAVFALAGLLALAACAMGAVAWLLHPPPAGTGRAAGFSHTASAPALQPAPQPELAAYQARKLAELARTGPDPQAPGYARIPVDRAMALMTERGLRADASPRSAAP